MVPIAKQTFADFNICMRQKVENIMNLNVRNISPNAFYMIALLMLGLLYINYNVVRLEWIEKCGVFKDNFCTKSE